MTACCFVLIFESLEMTCALSLFLIVYPQSTHDVLLLRPSIFESLEMACASSLFLIVIGVVIGELTSARTRQGQWSTF